MESRPQPSNRGARRALLGAALVAVVALWRCPIAALLGVPCPGCGLTRALLALASGDLGGALRLHPLSPLSLVLSAWLAWRELGARAPRRRALGSGSERLAGAAVGLLLGVWIARFFGAFGGPVQVSSYLHG